MPLISKAPPIIVAHRGASYAAPENTIPSFELAFNERADFIEGDFWLTNDNEIVCIHDPDTKRVSKNKIKLIVQSSSLAELKQIDVGSWKDKEFKGTCIPTLSEILQIIPHGKGIYIEIKDRREIFLKKLAETLIQFSLANDKIRIITFNTKVIKLAKKYFPDIKVYWLFGWYFLKRKRFYSFAQKQLMNKFQSLDCNGVDVNAAPYVDEKLIQFFHNSNLDFCAYDVDNLNDAISLINLGVDSITTNSPLKMREEIEKYTTKPG
jgi:glycerophosphoryl diester phosphodiesterase